MTPAAAALAFCLTYPGFAPTGVAVVFAHLDDDLLWFGPTIDFADKFILATIPTSRVYDSVLAAYPDPYRARFYPLWGETTDQDRLDFWQFDDAGRDAIVNERVLTALLEPHFKDPAIHTYVTHNAWGEYGHPHHVLVHNVVLKLAEKYNKAVWSTTIMVTPDGLFETEVTPRSGPAITFEVNQPEFERIRAAYQAAKIQGYDTWTWHDVAYPKVITFVPETY